MRDVTIIADDLTGAADTGIAFALAGLRTYVSFASVAASVDAAVVAFDTDSRALPPMAAAERAHAAARAAYRHGTRTVYKKIDSTLRGNVGAEIAATWRAASEATGRAIAIISPAFPGTGRTVRGGRVLVNGTPLENTEVWRKSGMSGPADLPAMLAAAGLEATTARAETPLPAGAQAVVCDAESEEDLASIARAGATLPFAVVWVGSAGLARHLPSALGLRRDPGVAAEQRVSEGPVLALVGSRSSVAREQARTMAGDPGVIAFELSPDVVIAGATAAREEIARALSAGTDVVVTIELGDNVDLGRAPTLAAALGRLAAAFQHQIGGLIATGGDIARAALGAMGAGGLHLVGEVEPGVPLGVTDTQRPLRVVTKAGAFGTPSTLQRCRAALKARGG
jgi:uncharacterized protein YgbK (DUF1537 family)